jgi:hypothetical protein
MTEYGKNTPAMYSAMTANVELFKSNEDATISQFGAINLQQLITALPSMTKREFDKRANDHLAAAQALEMPELFYAIEQETQAKSATPIGRRLATANILMFVREEAIAESILSRVRTLAPLAIARLNHENSILISNINDQEYQALIQSGVAGLVAYHDGGLTAQDVANVINFAQAVGVGVIAGRVK